MDSNCVGPYSVSFLQHAALGPSGIPESLKCPPPPATKTRPGTLNSGSKPWTRIETGSHVLFMTLDSITIGAAQDRHYSPADGAGCGSESFDTRGSSFDDDCSGTGCIRRCLRGCRGSLSPLDSSNVLPQTREFILIPGLWTSPFPCASSQTN